MPGDGAIVSNDSGVGDCIVVTENVELEHAQLRDLNYGVRDIDKQDKESTNIQRRPAGEMTLPYCPPPTLFILLSPVQRLSLEAGPSEPGGRSGVEAVVLCWTFSMVVGRLWSLFRNKQTAVKGVQWTVAL
jgi:hypothetical protein